MAIQVCLAESHYFSKALSSYKYTDIETVCFLNVLPAD